MMMQKKILTKENAHKNTNNKDISRFSTKKKHMNIVEEKNGSKIVEKKSELSNLKIAWPEHICKKCGLPIKDPTLAMSDKITGLPIHFDCVLKFLKQSEELKEKEELIYIGSGKFAIVYFENPKIRKYFKIVKLIEWEDGEKTSEWRLEMLKLGSST